MNNSRLKIETIRLGLFEAGYARVSREWNYKRLSSPFSRIYLIEQGEAVIRHSGQEHRLKAGDFHLVPCFVTADYSCPQSHAQFFAGFTMKLETGADLFAVRRCQPTLHADGQHRTAFERLTELAAPYSGPFGRLSGIEMPPGVDLEARGLVMQLAAVFLSTAKQPTDGEWESEGRFFPVLQFIEENFRMNISLDTLASLSGLTPTYFSDLFEQVIGVRPVEFINRRRIERAQLLLASTRLTVQEIADQVGINSPAYFSRLFRRIAGISPRRYRKLLLGI